MTIGSGHKQIGQLLLQAGVIDDLQLRSALGHQRQWGGRLGRILMELKFIDENTLVATLARQLGLESARITGEGLDPNVIALVPQTIAERYWIFPLSLKDSKGGGELTVAVADPTNLASVEDVRFHTGKRIKVVVAPESDIEGAIKRFYYGDATAPLAVAPAREEVFASSPTSLSDPEEDLMELEPIPSETQPGALAPQAADDPLENFFDGLTPPPVTGAEALVNFAPPEPVVAPPPPKPPSVFPDPAAAKVPLVSPEAPPPLRVEASVFDSPTPAVSSVAPSAPPAASAAPPPLPPPAAEAAPFIGEDEVSFQEAEPTEEPPALEPAPVQASAVAAPYPRAAEAALFEAAEVVLPPPPAPAPEAPVPVDVDVDVEVGPTAEAEPAPSGALPFDMPTAEEVSPPQPEVAFAVDLEVDAPPETQNEGAAFAALAPPLVGAAAVSVPSVIVSPSAVDEISPAPVEVPAAVIEVASAAAPEPAVVASEPPPAVAAEPAVASGPLGVAPFTEGELQIFDSLEARLVGGAEPAQVVNPAQLVSALIRLLLRKGLLAEAELIEELQKR